MENNVKQRLLEYLKFKRMSQREFAQSLGASDSYITSMRKAPSQKRLQMIAQNYPDLNITWLLTGQDNMINAEGASVSITQTAHHNSAPVHQNVTQLPPTENNENLRPKLPPQFVRQPKIDIYEGILSGAIAVSYEPVIAQFAEYDFTFDVQETCMAPRIQPGDLVAVRSIGTSPHIISGMVYIIDTGASGLIIRRLIDKGDSYLLQANDLNTPDATLPKSAVLRIYQFVGLLGYSPK